MATVISGILNQRLPWRLVLMGVAMVLVVEILGIRSLAFATGMYISVATTGAMFVGGLVRWAVETTSKEKQAGESEASPGALYSSGLIAAGGVFGLLAIVIRVVALAADPKSLLGRLPDVLARGPVWWPALASSDPNPPSNLQSFFGLLMFVLLAASLFHFARKKLD
jgi:hypothetical protein